LETIESKFLCVIQRSGSWRFGNWRFVLNGFALSSRCFFGISFYSLCNNFSFDRNELSFEYLFTYHVKLSRSNLVDFRYACLNRTSRKVFSGTWCKYISESGIICKLIENPRRSTKEQ
jgi:hypothetical protein